MKFNKLLLIPTTIMATTPAIVMSGCSNNTNSQNIKYDVEFKTSESTYSGITEVNLTTNVKFTFIKEIDGTTTQPFTKINQNQGLYSETHKVVSSSTPVTKDDEIKLKYTLKVTFIDKSVNQFDLELIIDEHINTSKHEYAYNLKNAVITFW